MNNLVDRLRNPWMAPEYAPPEFAEAADQIEQQSTAIKTLREALNYIVVDLEIRAIKGVVPIGNGAYVQAKKALAATEET